MEKISKRLLEIVNALPLKNGLRILEVGCGSGIAAREIIKRFDDIYIVGVDRSAKAIAQATKNSSAAIQNGQLRFIHAEIENFQLDNCKFDFAFAIRVGALDGRHPEIEREAISKISNMLKPTGKLYIDGGNPIKELDLKKA